MTSSEAFVPNKAGTHDFAGEWVTGALSFIETKTCSIGVFEWVQKAGGNGVKKGKVKVRITGARSSKDLVILKAREVVNALDAGLYQGPRTIRV